MKMFANFILIVSVSIGLLGCSEKTNTEQVAISPEPSSTPHVSQPSATPMKDLDAYGVSVARASIGNALTFKRVDDSMANFRVNRQDNFTMSSYIIYFTSEKRNYKLDKVRRDGDSAYLSNSKKMEEWKSQFCTKELLEIMHKHDIDFVMGQILTPNMSESDPMKLDTQCSK